MRALEKAAWAVQKQAANKSAKGQARKKEHGGQIRRARYQRASEQKIRRR